MPAPSPMTKPLRRRSNGRAARVQSPPCLDSAVSRMKPVTPSTWIIVWVPPEIMTSASPRRRMSPASPIACVLAAHAVRQLHAGPRMPNSRARWLKGMFGSCPISPRRSMVAAASLAHATVSTLPASGSHVFIATDA